MPQGKHQIDALLGARLTLRVPAHRNAEGEDRGTDNDTSQDLSRDRRSHEEARCHPAPARPGLLGAEQPECAATRREHAGPGRDGPPSAPNSAWMACRKHPVDAAHCPLRTGAGYRSRRCGSRA